MVSFHKGVEGHRPLSKNSVKDKATMAEIRQPNGKTLSATLTAAKPQTPSSGSSAEDRETVNTALSSAANSSVAYSVSEQEAGEDSLMPESFAERLVSQTNKKLLHILSKSTYIQENAKLLELPRYCRGDVDLGEMIAKGGFSHIHDIKSFGKKYGELAADEECKMTGDATGLVMKNLNPELGQTLKKVFGAAKDLVSEAFVLSSLDHEHIVKLRGWSADGIATFHNTLRIDSFFLVLDKLEGGTLFQKLNVWHQELRRQGKYTDSNLSFREIKQIIFQEQVQVGLDIASALSYLHSKRIMHRDLKSANVAFDNEGRAKLIDFGLACELQPSENPHETFKLSGNIGTARYMAPEVILEKPYNAKADVFSFSILLWEAMAVSKPYPNHSANEVKELVSVFGQRPKPSWSWPKRLRRVMKEGWSTCPEDRPSISEMRDVLIKVQSSPFKKKGIFKYLR